MSSSSSVKKEYNSTSEKKKSSSAAPQMLSRFASGTSLAKKQAAEIKRKARAMKEHVSSEGESDGGEDTASSEFDESDNELDSNSAMTGIKEKVLEFFMDASLDELSQISGCSAKKASRIIEMRPFKKWQTLVRLLSLNRQYIRYIKITEDQRAKLPEIKLQNFVSRYCISSITVLDNFSINFSECEINTYIIHIQYIFPKPATIFDYIYLQI